MMPYFVNKSAMSNLRLNEKLIPGESMTGYFLMMYLTFFGFVFWHSVVNYL